MNRYIKAMEIGLANEDEGISYFDLIKGLDKFKGKSMGEEAEMTFFTWFNENFTSGEGKVDAQGYSGYFIQYLKSKDKDGSKIQKDKEQYVDALKKDLAKKYFLDGQAAKQYLDYQELQQSVQTAKDAQTASIEANQKSTTSIRIAIAALIASAVLGIVQIVASRNPTYEVKIIEDNTKVNELQKENVNLREKLYKAEMMVKVLEETKPPEK